MAFKFFALFSMIALIAVINVRAAPYHSYGGYGGGHGGGDDGGYGGGYGGDDGGGHGGDDGGHGGDGGGHGGGGSSHQSFHLVSHDDGKGHDDKGHGGHDDGHDSHAEYNFDYGVSDKKTGDHKEHSEHRHGDKVTGYYELIDADGHKRTVHYTADKHNGFNAVVQYEPTGIHVASGKGGIFLGGHADVNVDGGHDFGGHDDGHGGKHGGGSSHSSYTIKQEHAVKKGHK